MASVRVKEQATKNNQLIIFLQKCYLGGHCFTSCMGVCTFMPEEPVFILII